MPVRETPLQLDLRAILRRRLPRKVWRLIPGFLICAVERLIRQRDLNILLRKAFPLEGSQFAASILDQLEIEVTSEGLDSLADRKRLVFASNHPLGGLDGITMVKLLGEAFGDDNIRVLVNDMLMNVQPLAGVFLPINKYGRQGRGAAQQISAAYASDVHICVYPAGLVSRLGDDGSVRDLEWKKGFVSKALETGRTIVPVTFIALNSRRFYRLARLRKKLGIKINLEQSLLPGEIFSQRGKRFHVIFGEPVTAGELHALGETPSQLASRLREAVAGRIHVSGMD